MLMSISIAGTTRREVALYRPLSICSCGTECCRNVPVHAGYGRVPRGAKEVPRGVGEGHRSISHPTLADRDNSPYICATFREALHWRPVGPLGEPLQKTNLIADP